MQTCSKLANKSFKTQSFAVEEKKTFKTYSRELFYILNVLRGDAIGKKYHQRPFSINSEVILICFQNMTLVTPQFICNASKKVCKSVLPNILALFRIRHHFCSIRATFQCLNYETSAICIDTVLQIFISIIRV